MSAPGVRLPLDRLLFATHDMTWEHVHRWQHRPRPPLLVEPLPDGWWFVHDGRHRATAAYEDGDLTVPALLVDQPPYPEETTP